MSQPAASRRALIFKFGQIGDVIMAIPAAHWLAEQGYAVDWVCGRAARPILGCYSWVHVLPVDDRAILRGSLAARAQAVFQLWRTLLPQRYDLCVVFYFDPRFRWLSLPVRAGAKVTLSRADRARTLLPGRHHTDEFARVLRAMLVGEKDGYTPDSTPPVRPDRLPPSPLATRATAARRIALAPGGTSNAASEQVLRRWPVEHYRRVAEQLLERGYEVVLVGGEEDRWVLPHFAGLPVMDTVARLQLPEVVSLFDSCDAVITHDAGPLHLAGLSKASVLGIFGPVDPATRVPRRAGTLAIWGGKGFACRPCYDGRNFAPCTWNGCMHQVTPARVLAALDELLLACDGGEQLVGKVVEP